MAKLGEDTHVLLNGEVKVYKRPNSKRWRATFQINGHWARASTGKRDLEQTKTVAREQYLDYKFSVKRVYQPTSIDTCAKIAHARLYTTRMPVTAADLFNDRVRPFHDEHDLTDPNVPHGYTGCDWV